MIPDSLPFAEYMRQIFWSSSNDSPDDVEGAIQRVTLDVMELGAGEKAAMSLDAAEGVCDRLRSGHPLIALSSGRGRGDQGAPQPVARRSPTPTRITARSRLRRGRRASRSRTRPPAGRCLEIWLHSEEMDKLTSRSPAVPDRDPSAQQPGVPRSLSHRDVRSRAAVQDHQPDNPVHRPQRVDRAL